MGKTQVPLGDVEVGTSGLTEIVLGYFYSTQILRE